MSDDLVTDDEWADYESGPFCAHWGDYECECKACDHLCGSHDETTGPCSECECAEFDEDGTLKQRATEAFT